MLSVLAATSAATVSAMPAMAVSDFLQAEPKVRIINAEAIRNGNLVKVNMQLDLAGLDMNRNRTLLLQPALINSGDTLRLEPIGIYGTTRYRQQLRIGGPLTGEGERMYRSGSRQLSDNLEYSTIVPYSPSFEGGELVILGSIHGCCNKVLDRGTLGPLATLVTPTPEPFSIGEPMWMLPDVNALAKRERGKKNRELTGRAFIDFPVNKTVIYPDYRSNPAELAKIRETLEKVFTDPDVTVRLISIKGYASPEGSYTNNTRLAKGRTEALRDYVRDIYKLPEAIFSTSYEPEDWAGLRAAVDTLANLSDRTALLEVIDSDISPDEKDAALKRRFPSDYAYLLTNIYPSLRHSDYLIEYLVRDFEEAAIIEAVMNNDATKLSPEEFYIAAASHEPGSPEFLAIYAIELRYYPDDRIANYNMALSALEKGDIEAAESRLEKVGDCPETQWLRSKIAELREYNEALIQNGTTH